MCGWSPSQTAERVHVHGLHADGGGAVDVVDDAVADVQDPLGRPGRARRWSPGRRAASGLPTPTTPESVTTSTGTPGPSPTCTHSWRARWSATVPSLFDVTARRRPASASARSAVARPGHRLAPHRGAEDVDERVVGPRAVGLGHADRGEEPREVVGEVLGVGRGPVHRRHGLVVADAEAVAVVRDAEARRARRPSAPWSGTTSTPPTSRLTASKPRAIGCRGYGRPPLLPPAAGRPRLRPVGSDRPPDGELRVPRRRSRDRRGGGDRPRLRHPGPARHPRRRRACGSPAPSPPTTTPTTSAARWRASTSPASRRCSSSRRCRSTCRPTRCPWITRVTAVADTDLVGARERRHRDGRRDPDRADPHARATRRAASASSSTAAW